MPRIAADATVFHAIADPTRRDILMMLRGGERAASELAEPFAASQSAISQHLAVLLRAGLVDARRAGRRRLYRVKPKPLRKVADWVAFFDEFWDEKFDALSRYLEQDS